jgi:Divergent InlB B-repeat domain
VRDKKRTISGLVLFLILVLFLLGTASLLSAAQVTLAWNDNSTNEDGFSIERRRGTSGTYQEIVKVASNIVSYTDLLSDGTTYCYRIRAFNSRGYSSYSNESCVTLSAPATFTLTVSRTGSGRGTITSSPTGINCKSDCSETYSSGTVVALSAVAASNSVFSGWSGNADCTDGNVTLNANINCIATFNLASGTSTTKTEPTGTVASSISGRDKVGVFRPSTGEWFLDRNGSSTWDGCQVDSCARLFTGSNALPVVGDWNGDGVTKLGLFAADSSEWFLDANGNGIWDGCEVDICSQSVGDSTDLPVVGRWKKRGEDRIAIFRRAVNQWHLDINGNERFESCKIDRCPSLSIYQLGDVPVTGDWRGRGTTQLGLFRPSTGEWFLDRKNSGSWNGCKKDLCISSFGLAGDIPVSGDWNGTGITHIGVFRPSRGEWFLDLNGNGTWDGPSVDLYVAGFGHAGDIPVIGNW